MTTNQYEFDFDVDVNDPTNLTLHVVLHDPCQTCMKRESEQTVPKTGDGICNSCAEDAYMDWIERMND